MNAEHLRPARAAKFSPIEFITAPLLDRRTLFGAMLFTLLYVAMSVWFHTYDVYNRIFSQAGPIYAVYHVWKIVAIFYLLWLACFIGLAMLETIEALGPDFGLGTLDRIITAFYAGGSAIAIGMYFLGLLALYYTPLILVLTTPVIWVSFPYFQQTVKAASDSLRRASGKRGFTVQVLLASVMVALLGSLLLNKGLLPFLDHDGLTHYTPYYVTVIRNHSIAPNEIWYHYFYSKGSGLMFLGMLVTDETGHKLVSFCMVLAVSAVLYSLSKKLIDSPAWSFAMVIVYVSTLIFEPLEYNTAVFEKQHIFMASLIVGIIFMIAMLRAIPAQWQRWWTGLCALLIIHLAIFAPTAIAFILPLFLVCTAYYGLRKRSEAWFFAVTGGVGAITLGLVLLCNYLAVGMFDINMTRLMWRIANQQEFSKWVSPYMVVYQNEGSNPSFAKLTLQKEFPLDKWFYNVFHLERIQFFLPGVLTACILAMVAFSRVRKRTMFPAGWTILLPAAILLVTSGAVTLAFNQPISMFRYFVFTTPLLILIAVSGWFFVLTAVMGQKRSNTILDAVAVLIVCAALVNMYRLRGIATPPKTQVRFLLGRISFQDAFRLRNITWPELVEAKRQIGLEERILTLDHSATRSAAPGRPVEAEIDYAYRDWHLMVFGSAETAKAAFQKEGINYFILGLEGQFTFALPHSPLFAPDRINDYFDVVYAKGRTYLLTWKGSGRSVGPLPQEAVEAMNRKLHSKEAYTDLYDRVKLYFDRNHGAAYPVRSDPSLPPVAGWQ